MTSIPCTVVLLPQIYSIGRSIPTDGGGEREVTGGEMNSLQMRLNGRRTPYPSHLRRNICCAWSRLSHGPAVQNRSVRECRRAGSFVRNGKDHALAIGNHEQIHRDIEASESSQRHVWQSWDLVILSWRERTPSCPPFFSTPGDDQGSQCGGAILGASEPGCAIRVRSLGSLEKEE